VQEAFDERENFIDTIFVDANDHEVTLVQLSFDFDILETRPKHLIGDRAKNVSVAEALGCLGHLFTGSSLLTDRLVALNAL